MQSFLNLFKPKPADPSIKFLVVPELKNVDAAFKIIAAAHNHLATNGENLDESFKRLSNAKTLYTDLTALLQKKDAKFTDAEKKKMSDSFTALQDIARTYRNDDKDSSFTLEF